MDTRNTSVRICCSDSRTYHPLALTSFSHLPSPNTHRSSASNKGLKKKVLNSLPKLTYRNGDEQTSKLSECAICLADFATGDEIRVLPQCGHGFHVGCIDTWLGSHSTCPSCRQILVEARCKECSGARRATPCAGTEKSSK